MMKSKGSCFKIITCARDTEDNDDDLEPNESKRSTDKSRWSFRKRSARHRVLSNSANTESPSIGNRDSLESTSINYNTQSNLTTPEKISVSHWASDYPLTGVANSNAPLIDTNKDFKNEPVISTENARVIDPSIFKQDVKKVDHKLEEVSAVVIQSAIRGYLAKRKLLKQKNVIKLQAAVRGHLVRNQAVGTLRCVQAISKMQVLVRARRARHEASAIETKSDGHEVKENSDTSSTEKLLSNAFARQIMQSTANKKQIHIKCDPLKQDSAWQWLDRWMSVSSSDLEPNKQQCTTVSQKQDEYVIDTASEVGNEISAEVISASKDMQSTATNAGTSVDNEDNLITYEADNFVFQASRPTSTSTNDMQPTCVDDLGVNEARASSSKSGMRQPELLSTAPSQTASRSISDKPMADSEQPKRSMKRVASEQPETENKKTVFGSRKATNPAFVAVQSKFKGLSSGTTSRKSISSTTQDVGAESKLNLSSSADSWKKTQEPNLTESSISHEIKVQVAPSECGSLLSITSTLDSPERSEAGGVDVKQETAFVEKVASELNMATDTASSTRNLDAEPRTDICASQPISSRPASSQPGSSEDGKRESLDLDLAVEQQKQERQPDRCASDAQSQIDVAAYQQAYRSSPEGSPRSHVTIPESYGTPSSQVSVNAKRNKWDKSGPTQTRKHHPVVKRSPSNQNYESGGKSSAEQSSKDSKNAKRRSSFGSAKSSNLNQEPRDSSSSSTLPSYMQVTESRRAKVLVSPRSSPDVQDKEIYIKKRHSLPSTSGKQGSPRMERSMSQALQGVKGNNANSPHEKKWVR
ncbi:hypothetical protein MKX01_023857 [Papaver californicum]|nr:hypothetical protein MKX01_023857 [Papaver californicum]